MIGTMPTDPIIEAVFDIRFNCNNPAIASMLLGVFRSGDFHGRFRQVERLPVSDMPLAMRDNDPQLRFQPELRLHGEQEVLMLGPHNFGYAIQRPYIGWSQFNSRITELLSSIKTLDEDIQVERVAFRYINLIPSTNDQVNEFDVIRFNGALGPFDLSKENSYIKIEVPDGELKHIIQVKNKASIVDSRNQEELTGLVLDIDSSKSVDLENFWDNFEDTITSIRDAERQLFEDIVEEDVIKGYMSDA